MASAQPATLKAIAEACGVSMTTVSKILRGVYKGNTPKGRASVEAVTTLARRLGYIANGSARRLRDGRQRAVVVLTPVDHNGHPEYLTFEYIAGLAGVLGAARYALAIHTYQRGSSDQALGRLTDRSFDGVVVLDMSSPEIDRFIAGAGIPAVYVNVEPARGRHTLNRDELAAGERVTEVLAGLGYRRLHVVGGTDGSRHYSMRQRLLGVERAAAAARLALTRTPLESWEGGFDDAIVAARIPADTAVLALGASIVLRLLHCLPPAQPLASCDDAHLFLGCVPGLTRATFDRASLGRVAAEHILRLIEAPQTRFDNRPMVPGVHVGSSTPSLPGRRG